MESTDDSFSETSDKISIFCEVEKEGKEEEKGNRRKWWVLKGECGKERRRKRKSKEIDCQNKRTGKKSKGKRITGRRTNRGNRIKFKRKEHWEEKQTNAVKISRKKGSWQWKQKVGRKGKEGGREKRNRSDSIWQRWTSRFPETANLKFRPREQSPGGNLGN